MRISSALSLSQVKSFALRKGSTPGGGEGHRNGHEHLPGQLSYRWIRIKEVLLSFPILQNMFAFSVQVGCQLIYLTFLLTWGNRFSCVNMLRNIDVISSSEGSGEPTLRIVHEVPESC